MCECEPRIKTPYCGRGDCQMPEGLLEQTSIIGFEEIQEAIRNVEIQKDVENLLMNYMDGTHNGFEKGYILDLFDVKPLRDDIIKLIKIIIKST